MSATPIGDSIFDGPTPMVTSPVNMIPDLDTLTIWDLAQMSHAVTDAITRKLGRTFGAPPPRLVSATAPSPRPASA